LAVGSAGNISARAGDVVAITPSGIAIRSCASRLKEQQA
jgi:ribulose-5-phosphate 4-epimerase/fuculose-1-phosphate aldolase